MASLKLNLPESLVPHKAHIQFFMQMMIIKLHTNSHKGFAEGVPFKKLMEGLMGEYLEFRDALKEEGQFSATAEAADMANFALLLGTRALTLTRDEYDKETKNESVS